jgi:diguanylate cyclase (GGDEF)-like protein
MASIISSHEYAKAGSNAELSNGTQPTKLTDVLKQSEHVKDLVKECAKELSSINVILKRGLADRDPLPDVENVLEKSAAVESKIQAASEKLSVLNRALKDEVRDRQMLDHQFAAATEQEEAARHSAFHDVLTGLPNRALFNDRLEHGFAQAKRHGLALAVMFVDLDDFKIINDSHGHAAGDGVLQTIARRLQDTMRGEDTVSRHGGDEFLYLLTEIRDEKSIAMIAEKIIQVIQAPCNVSVRDLNISPSVKASIGISIYPKDGTTADALVKSADKAMYQAKQHKSGYAFAP